MYSDHIGQEHSGHIVTVVLVGITHRAGDAGIVDQHIEVSLVVLDGVGGMPY
jgi:hypothetical protein